MFLLVVAVGLCLAPLPAQDSKGKPVSEKARKAYQEGLKDVQERRQDWAPEEFKKADKQDGGQCLACQQKMIKYRMALGDSEP